MKLSSIAISFLAGVASVVPSTAVLSATGVGDHENHADFHADAHAAGLVLPDEPDDRASLLQAKMMEQHAASSAAMAKAVEALKTEDLGTRIQAFEGAVDGIELMLEEMESMEPSFLKLSLKSLDTCSTAWKADPPVATKMKRTLKTLNTDDPDDDESEPKPSVTTGSKTTFGKGSGNPKDEPTFLAHHRRKLAKLRNADHFEGNHRAAHQHQRITKLHDAILSADHEHIGKVVRAAATKAGKSRADGRRRRRLTDAEDKSKQCHQLTMCAKEMSFYDVLVYFYSDDIDPTSGEIDDSIYLFNEADLEDMYSRIILHANTLFTAYGDDETAYTDDDECDSLLQLFHRNVEFAGVPYWEGGMVSQVCLAEGTHTFLKLDEIALKIGSYYARQVAAQMFTCAQDLYNTGLSSQPFPLTTTDLMTSTSMVDVTESGLAISIHNSEQVPYVDNSANANDVDFLPENLIDDEDDGVSTEWKCFVDDNDDTLCDSTQNVYFKFDGTLQRIDQMEITFRDGDFLPDSYKILARKQGEWGWTTVLNSLSGTHAVDSSQQVSAINGGGASVTLGVEKHTIPLGFMPTPPDYIVLRLYGSIKYSIFNVDFYTKQYSNGVNILVPPSGIELDNRDENGQIEDVTQPVFEYKGDPMTDLDTYANELQLVYKKMHSETTEENRGDIMPMAKNWADTDGSVGQGAFTYYQADEAISFLTFMVDGEFPPGDRTQVTVRNRQGKIRKGLKALKKEIRTGLNDAYGEGGSEEEYDDSYDSVAEWLLNTKAASYYEAFQRIQLGFDLVFGEKTSVGFLCGIKEAVVAAPEKWPGYCCLSAPFQNEGDDWGRKHDCDTTSTYPGPFFAGLSDDSCAANGGTWCAADTDCSDLQSCVQTEYDTAVADKKGGYAEYLKGGLVGTATDPDDCGSSREYFGYDALYTHDLEICDQVQQLHNTQNFAFLEEFFDQGSEVGRGEEFAVDWEALSTPDRVRSGSYAVIDGEAWQAANFYISQIFAPIDTTVECVMAYKCPDGPFGDTVCCVIVNSIYLILKVALSFLEMAFNISEFIRESLSDPSNVEPIQAYENTAVLYDNMVATNENVKLAHDNLKSVIETECGTTIRERNLEETEDGVAEELASLQKQNDGIAAKLDQQQKQNAAMSAKMDQQQMQIDAVSAKLDQQQKQNDAMLEQFSKVNAILQQLLAMHAGNPQA
ncbi:expressed unknown protein [Seminavis robusta]|uniref:Uncharacterized protein n=1 Tax=Seminavis robusta TaxID=568900 RepID=A0A9N8EAI3_9STRA|nr:expressed unknown protein [Seminavis robusta]|eukprot:Sro885_g216050.1 n/a (1195) ;mRNA; r:12633-17214